MVKSIKSNLKQIWGKDGRGHFLEGLADVQNKNCTLKLPSLKQTSHSPESSNGWKMISFFLGPGFFQGRTVSFRERTTATTKKGWGWKAEIAMFYVL